MPTNAIYLGVFWLFYYTIHSALATERIKRFFAIKVPLVAGWCRLLYSLFAVINFALLFWFQSITPSKTVFTNNTIEVLGILIGVAALIVFVLAFRQYKFKFWVSNQDDINTTLVTSGLNRWVRHPLYFAVILALVSMFLIWPKWKNLIFAVITILYIIIGALLEERKLLNKYGTVYMDYRNEVKMLIPFVI